MLGYHFFKDLTCLRWSKCLRVVLNLLNSSWSRLQVPWVRERTVRELNYNQVNKERKIHVALSDGGKHHGGRVVNY